MFVSADEMLKKAVAGKYAVGHFNINNLEWTKEIFTRSRRSEITGYSWGFRRRRKIYDRF